MSIFIYNITLQNTDFGVLQKSSKRFLIFIFFPSGEGGGLPVPPHSPFREPNEGFVPVYYTAELLYGFFTED